MKRIIFKNQTAQRIYDDYFKRVNRCIKILSAEDQLELQMELNSHVYEATHAALPENEIDTLMNVLEKLGPPEVTLQPSVAYKKAQQAGRSFNPKHILQALYLNTFRGIGYFIIALIYLFIIASGSLIVLKIVSPERTGFFVGNGRFFMGYNTHPVTGLTEVLGNWFIITVIILMILFYFLNTLLFRLLKRK